MNKKAWFKTFNKKLSPLNEGERKNAVMYYEEMFCDKMETGMTEEEVLYEFGYPEACANKILLENGITPQAVRTRPSIAAMIGIGLFLILFGIPIAAVILSVIIAFAVVAITGAALAVSGVFFGIISSLVSLSVLSGQGIAVQIGLGIACSGVGALAFVGFGFLTKFAVQLSIKGIKLIFNRRGAV